jgi:hypothetical protein
MIITIEGSRAEGKTTLLAVLKFLLNEHTNYFGNIDDSFKGIHEHIEELDHSSLLELESRPVDIRVVNTEDHGVFNAREGSGILRAEDN